MKTLAAGISVVFVLAVIDTPVMFWPTSPRPVVMPAMSTDVVPEFSRTTIGLGVIGVIVGGWFTALIVTRNVRVRRSTPPLAVPPLSFTVTLMVAVPKVLGVGVIVNVPVGALGV